MWGLLHPVGSNPGPFVETGGHLYFTVQDPAAGTSLWSPDGTAGGSRRLVPLLRQRSDPGAMDEAVESIGGDVRQTSPANTSATRGIIRAPRAGEEFWLYGLVSPPTRAQPIKGIAGEEKRCGIPVSSFGISVRILLAH
jgi:ELWxxDGT repeat protein